MSLSRIFTLSLLIALISSCGKQSVDDLIIFTNANIWNGIDQTIAENSALITKDGRVVQITSMNDPDYPREAQEIDLEGRYLIPGIINTHGHIGIAIGLDTGASTETIDNVVNQLSLNARYGITTVVSLGDEPIHAFLVRENIDPSSKAMARVFLAGRVLNPATVDLVEEDVSRLMQNQPDWVKIRVDDGLGTREKMSKEIYSEIIKQAHQHNTPVAVHIVNLEDAKEVVKSGGDLIAHSVRDVPVDDELIELMLENNVCITPTLTRELSTFIYAEQPPFFDDPFFLKEADSLVIEQLQLPRVQELFKGADAEFYRNALPRAEINMMELHRSGVKVALGTDSGPPARFQGYFEHIEMEMMQDAGMSPLEVLTASTRIAAECMRIDDELGTLENGKWADFVVLDRDPFENVRNLRSIDSVYIGGNEVKR